MPADSTDPTPDQLRGQRIAERRRARFNSKADAYRAAGIDPRTWDRLEAGGIVRDATVTAAVRTLWPASEGVWDRIDDEAPDPAPVTLRDITDAELIAELARRLADHRTT